MVNALLTTAVPNTAILPAAVHVNAPVGINVIVPPPAEIGAGAVIVTTAAVPLINTILVVGAIVAALAIVGAAAVVANRPDILTLVNVGLPVQLSNTPLVGVPNTGVTITMLVLVQAEITPLATVPNTGAVIVGEVKVGEVKVGVANVGLVPNTNAPEPVSPVTAVAKLALEGVAKNVATPAPNPLMPDATGKPVQFVSVPDVGVPNIGVVNVGLVNKLATDNCLVVLVVLCTIGNTSAPACEVATGNAEMAMFDIC
jgi:hypothetical protein